MVRADCGTPWGPHGPLNVPLAWQVGVLGLTRCMRHGTNTLAQQKKARGSIVVGSSACHTEDPGSIPGRGAS